MACASNPCVGLPILNPNFPNYMSVSRRKFVSTAGAAVALTAIGSRAEALGTAPEIFVRSGPPQSTNYKELVMAGVSAAKSAGAQYADVRISRNRTQSINTRERRVQGLSDNETFGFGVRALVDGAWGFAASRDLTRDEVARVARQAVAQARANRAALVRPVVLAPVDADARQATWRSPIEIDPFTSRSRTRSRCCSRPTRPRSRCRARAS